MHRMRTVLAGFVAVATVGPVTAWAQSAEAYQGVREVVRRPVYETHYEPREYVTYEAVPETRWRTETVSRWEPVTRTRRIVVDEGRWERVWVPKLGDFDQVWVPKLVEREQTETTYEKHMVEKQVPYQATRTVPVRQTRYEPVVTRRIVEEHIVRAPAAGDDSLARAGSTRYPGTAGSSYNSRLSSRPTSLASRSAASIPASRLGSYRPTTVRARAEFDQLETRVAARSGAGPSQYRATGGPSVPTAALAWQASGTLRR